VRKRLEQLLITLDASPWEAVTRVAIGFAILPAMSWTRLDGSSTWMLVPLLLIVLLLLRIVPFCIRCLIRFSPDVCAVWSQRRYVAKRYDSYQWRKLFWIGVGISLYTGISGQFLVPRVVVSGSCLLAGALGLARWHALHVTPGSQAASTNTSPTIP
jgi:hypothetical protein